MPDDDFLQGVLPIQKLQKYKSESKIPKMISKQIRKLLRNKRKYDQHMLQQLIKFLIQKLSYHNQQPNSLIYLGNNSQMLFEYDTMKSLSSKTPITKEDFLSVIIPQSQYGAHSKPSDYQSTVTPPQLFNFDKREKDSSLSIREKKLEEILEEKKRNNSFKVFKGQEVPQIVKQDGLYDKNNK